MHEELANLESVLKTISLYKGKELTIIQLSSASQVHGKELRNIVEQLKRESKLDWDGVRIKIPNHPG